MHQQNLMIFVVLKSIVETQASRDRIAEFERDAANQHVGAGNHTEPGG
jgi:hypothetical protein